MMKGLVINLAVIVLFATGNIVRGELLFSDSFDTSESSTDVNFEIDNRTLGTYGGTNSIVYKPYTDRTAVNTVGAVDGSRTVLEMAPGGSSRQFVWLNHNFNGADSAGGLNVEFTAKSEYPNDDSYWFAVGIAGPDGSNSTDSDRCMSNGLCIFFRGNGEAWMRENGSSKESFTWISGGNDLNYHDFLIEITGVGDDNPFDGAGAFNVKLYRDGGVTPLIDYECNLDSTNNYIGLEFAGLASSPPPQYNGYYDSLSITQVPEPSTLALLGMSLIGLLAYAWRKRK